MKLEYYNPIFAGTSTGLNVAGALDTGLKYLAGDLYRD